MGFELWSALRTKHHQFLLVCLLPRLPTLRVEPQSMRDVKSLHQSVAAAKPIPRCQTTVLVVFFRSTKATRAAMIVDSWITAMDVIPNRVGSGLGKTITSFMAHVTRPRKRTMCLPRM